MNSRVSYWVCPACEVSKSFSKNPELDDPDLTKSERESMPQLVCNECGELILGKIPVYRE